MKIRTRHIAPLALAAALALGTAACDAESTGGGTTGDDTGQTGTTEDGVGGTDDGLGGGGAGAGTEDTGTTEN